MAGRVELPPMTLNPLVTAYAKANGRTWEEQLAYDRERYPGGCMAGFLTWSSEQWQRFMLERHPTVGREFRSLYIDELLAWLEATGQDT